jgi:diguanylate cyclase (GGDEF)-like protein
MERIRPEEIDVVVAAQPDDDDGARVERLLRAAGFVCHRAPFGLEGLSRVAGIRPQAIVILGLDTPERDWLLNFVDENPDAPAVVAVGPTALLEGAPQWLYDVVPPEELEVALVRRVERAVAFQDMRRLAGASTEELGRSGAHIRMVSMIDVVTGLFNRRYFKKHLRESYSGARRYRRPLTCLVLRVEGLRELIADRGQERTNDVLDSVALAITTVIRESDIAARIDDDMFAFLLPETTEEGASGLVQRLIARLRAAKLPYDANVSFTTAHGELKDWHPDGQSLMDSVVAEVLGETPVAS